MAKAMIGGILSSGLAAPDCVTASNPSAPKLDTLKEEFGIRTIQQGNAKGRCTSGRFGALRQAIFV